MAENVGFATLSIIPSFDGFERRLESGTGGSLTSVGGRAGTRFGDAAGKSAGSRFGSVFKNAAKGALLGIAGAGALAIKFGGDAISAASDLEESTNKVTQIFGDAAGSVLKFTETTADALGQTNTQAREAASTFGIFAGAAGLSERKSAKFAKRMTTLASDLASFNNTEPDEAVQALGAALRGETEPIRAYGVLLDEATLKAEALALGILKPVKNASQIKAYQVAITEGQLKYNEAVEESGKNSLEALKAEAALGTARDRLAKATAGTIPPLTQQQKLLAAQSQIFKQTEVAQGDFARTSDGLANQQRRLSARFEDAKAKLGKGLLPIMTQAADFLLDKGIPAFEDFSGWFNKEGIPAIEEFAGFLGDEVVPKLKKAGDFAKDFVDAFKGMPDWARTAIVTGALGGIAAKKFGVGSLVGSTSKTGGSGLLGLVTKTKPLPVFVVNNGVGGGADIPGGGKGPLNTILKGVLPAAVLAGAVVGVDKLLNDAVARHPNAKPSDFGASNEGFVDFSKPTEKVQKFNAELKTTQALFYTNKAAVEEFGQSIRTRIPRTINTTVTGWDVAKQDVRDYIALLLEARSIHMDTRLDAAGGSGPTTPSSGGNKGGSTTGGVRGRTIVQNNTYNVNTIGDADKHNLHREQQVALGGFG